MKNVLPKRLPFLLWGDLRKNKKALLRYALAGEEAHLPIYFYVYLREYFEYKKLAVTSLKAKSLKDLKTKLKRLFPNKLWLLENDQILRAYFIKTVGDYENKLNVWELGSTLFTISTKVDYLIGAFGKKTKIDYHGIEKNEYLSQLSKILHPSCKVYPDIKHINPLKKKNKNLFVSRFVSSYVFKNTDALADQISLFDYAFLTEPFNFNGGDCVRYNHGLPNTFFDFCALLNRLHATHNLFSAGYYYDHPAGTAPCFVCDLVIVAKNAKHSQSIQTKLNQSFDTFERIGDPAAFMKRVRSEINKKEKTILKVSKLLNPVWGKVDLSNQPMKIVLSLIKSILPSYKKYNFKFNNYYLIKRALADQLR
jgi:hypothetical protein